MTKIIAVLNHKGGGRKDDHHHKSGYEALQQKKSVLAIDMDGRGKSHGILRPVH